MLGRLRGRALRVTTAGSAAARSGARRAPCQVCNARDQCYTCWPRTGCAPLKEYNRLVVREHGRLHGAAAMKAEVRALGRIWSPGLCLHRRGAVQAHVCVGDSVTGGSVTRKLLRQSPQCAENKT